jgi:hypothetical protein
MKVHLPGEMRTAPAKLRAFIVLEGNVVCAAVLAHDAAEVPLSRRQRLRMVSSLTEIGCASLDWGRCRYMTARNAVALREVWVERARRVLA